MDNTTSPPVLPAVYKKMVKKTADTTSKGSKPAQQLSNNGKPLSPTNPLMVEKADGSIAQWGNDIKIPKTVIPAIKKAIPLSDKSKGLSNTYYPANQQQQGPSVPTQKKSPNY